MIEKELETPPDLNTSKNVPKENMKSKMALQFSKLNEARNSLKQKALEKIDA